MRAVLLLFLVGCTSVLGLDKPGSIDASVVDGTIDAPPTPDALPCGSGVDVIVDNYNICQFNFEPAMPFQANETLNTGIDAVLGPKCSGSLPQTNGPTVCVIAAKSFRIDPGITLTVQGKNPLMLVADDSIEILGTLSTTANKNGDSGPCSASQTGNSGGGTNDGGAGGGGGSFQLRGGAGGDTSFGGGSSGMITTPAAGVVRGGCRGADGGSGALQAGLGGVGGDGGGAVWLVARNDIRVTGIVTAPGSGGGGGRTGTAASAGDGGGGGGGAGGYIRLSANHAIDVTGTLAANGGGGGEGGGTAPGENGASGASDTFGAPGGNGVTSGADGGGGGSRTSDALAGYASGDIDFPGGGGGGSIGWIYVRGTAVKNLTGRISPAQSP